MVGVGLAVFLFITAGILTWGYSFADRQVKGQLQSQSIILPATTGNSDESADITAFFIENGDKPMTRGILLLVLSIAGWVHLRRTPAEATF